MNGKKAIPSQDELRGCSHAVAGHAGTLCDADGELFIKPCTQSELDFYQTIETHGYRDFAEIMPVFMGELRLSHQKPAQLDDKLVGIISGEGDVKTTKEQISATMVEQVAKVPAPPADPNIWIPTEGKKIKTDRAVVLENTSFGFQKPNILDVKLGKRLWADDAPAEKKRRFDAISSQTTHGKLGFRIAGMRIYHAPGNEADWDEEGYKNFDKDYGRFEVNNDNVADALRKFVFNKTAGIDDDLGRAVCAAFVRDLERVEDVLTSHESRMYSCSLLFTFEGDGKALHAAISENNNIADEARQETVEGRKVTANKRTQVAEKPRTFIQQQADSGIDLDDDDSDDCENFSEAGSESLPNIFSVKLIDFAHAKFTPGQGPDENILLGVRSLLRIFRGLSREES